MVNITETQFSDIYITPDKIAYIPDKRTANGLIVFEPEDFEEFYALLEATWDGKNPSYSVFTTIFLPCGTQYDHLRRSILCP